MGQGVFNSANTPELRTVPRIWICIDPNEKMIITGVGDDVTTRTYADDDFSEQLTAAAIEERLK